MRRKVFYLDKGEMTVFEETGYTEIKIMDALNEEGLRRCIERYPELIPADQIDVDEPPQFVVVKSEAGVTAGSIDILMLDNKGILTIVETKLYQNREIRRAVLGQAFEYASHLVIEWGVDKIRNEGNIFWEKKNKNFENMIAEKFNLSDDGRDEFWERVRSNIEHMDIRIIIAADTIPKELRQVIAFINRNSKFDLLALEIKLFADESGKKLLVPYIIGSTEEKKKTEQRSNKWTAADIEKHMASEENTVKRDRFLNMLQYCKENNILRETQSQKPSFQIINSNGKRMMTFNYDGSIYTALNPNRFDNENDFNRYIEHLNKLTIFEYDKDIDAGHGKNSKGKIDDLTDEGFTELKNIIVSSSKGKNK